MNIFFLFFIIYVPGPEGSFGLGFGDSFGLSFSAACLAWASDRLPYLRLAFPP
jgi:hypothetical protein